MIKNTFFGFRKPRLPYLTVPANAPAPVEVPLPEKVVLMVPINADQAALIKKKKTVVKKGDTVEKGQLLSVFDGSTERVLCSATGKVSSVETTTGIYSHLFLSITIEVDAAGTPPTENGDATEISEPGLWSLIKMLPGLPSPDIYRTSVDSFHTIVIAGGDTDLLMTGNQYTLINRRDDLMAGIDYLKNQVPDKALVLAIPEYLEAQGKECGLPIHLTNRFYPSSVRRMIELDLTKKEAKTDSDRSSGYLFLSAEAIANLGNLQRSGSLSIYKLITVTGKNGNSTLVSARVGTPVRDVVRAAGNELNIEDHIIYGGPFTGTSIYSGDIPVMSDTDAIIIEGQESMPRITDNFCINCGDCIRVCPVGIPVNLLIRLLEKDQYEEAVQTCGLKSCIECGMCSFVCTAKIPLFQRIKLARTSWRAMREASSV